MRSYSHQALLCLLLVGGCLGSSVGRGALRSRYTQGRTWVQAPTDDVVQIRRLVLGALDRTVEPGIAGIRWTSAAEVIVHGKWRNAGAAAGSAYFLLREENGRWRIVARQDER